MKRIAVCLKQVPRLDQVRFDRRNRIVREDVELVINPLDVQALGHALALREAVGGEIVALTMGPESARQVLEEALRRGADRAVHLVDRRFAGADTLATARALARALEREEPDVVLFGRSTLDGGTAQVGPQVAELLGWPQVTHVTELEAGEDGTLRARRETERGSEAWSTPTPVAIAVERGPEPAEATKAATEAAIEELTSEDLGGTPRDYGTRGSPTLVKAVRELSLAREVEWVEGVEAGAKRLVELVPGGSHDGERSSDDARADGHTRALWVLAERDGERLHATTLEAIACAHEVAGDLHAEVVAVLPCADPDGLPDELAAHGADRVLVIRDPALAEYATGPFTDALAAALEAHDPFAVIAPWSAQGRDHVPRVAARLGLGLTGDFVRLEVADPDEDEPDLQWIKPAWAGTVESPILTHRTPSIGTLRPGVFRALARREGVGAATVEELKLDLAADGGALCEERHVELEEPMLLDNAPVVVCVGDELGEEGVDAARKLAEATGGSLAATSRAVAVGLAPPQLELGVLKRTLSPLLLVALGVHEEAELDAVRGARRLVTVHAESDAPGHTRADLAIVADPVELARAAAERLAGAARG